MKEQSIIEVGESRPVWESLEALARQGVQRLLQQLLEEEVEQALGRAWYARRDGVDATPGYRNGWGKPRRLSAMAGTITVRRPRVRGLEARFEYAETSGLTFVHGQFRSGYWTRGEVLSHFIGTEGQDYYARVTNRLAPNLMLGLELNRAVIGSTVAGFGGPKERRVSGGIDLSWRFFERYSLFGGYRLADVTNRNFRRGDDGFDHLFRVELTRSFR